jgi:hypothetical protein
LDELDRYIARKIITESAVSYAASMSGANYDLFAKVDNDEPKAPKIDKPKKKGGGFLSRVKAKISSKGGSGGGGGGGDGGSGGGGSGECCVENQYGGGGCGPCDRSK